MSTIARMPLLHAQRPIALIRPSHHPSSFSSLWSRCPHTKKTLPSPKRLMSTRIPSAPSAGRCQPRIRSRALVQSHFISHTLWRQATAIRNFQEGVGRTAKSHSNTRLAIYIIIGLNTAVFFAWRYAMATDNRIISSILRAGFITSKLHMRLKHYFSLVGAAFSHHDPSHLLFNMFSFWTMSNLLVFMPGIRAFHIVAITLSSGVLGNVAQLSINPAGDRVLLGASGAVMGIAAVATCYAPFTPMQFMFIPINIPLWVFTVGYALVDSYSIKSETSLIGHAAHVGGALAGVAYYALFLRKYGALLRRR